MAGLRVTTSGQTGIHHSSFLWAGVRRTDKSCILQEVSSHIVGNLTRDFYFMYFP